MTGRVIERPNRCVHLTLPAKARQNSKLPWNARTRRAFINFTCPAGLCEAISLTTRVDTRRHGSLVVARNDNEFIDAFYAW